MPKPAASRPANWAGNSSPAGVSSSTPQVNTPKPMENTAPWVVARRQYKPHTKGTNAPTKVT